MDLLQAMETFIRVRDTGSFKKAAETLHVLPSTVTRTIKALEAQLGTRLLHRTTRALSLTDAGLRYYDRCQAVLREVQAAHAAAAPQSGSLSGTLRVGATPSFAKAFLIPHLPRFLERHRAIHLDFHLGDATVDLAQHGIDCVIRAGVLPPSRLVARRLGAFQWYVCGSPAYLDRHGVPEQVSALASHQAVGYVSGRTGRQTEWVFRHGTQTTALAMPSHVGVNDTDAYVAAGVAGLGLIRVASYMVRRQLAEGSLIRLLPDAQGPQEPISLVYPQHRHPSALLRTFIDWSIEVVGKEAKYW